MSTCDIPLVMSFIAEIHLTYHNFGLTLIFIKLKNLFSLDGSTILLCSYNLTCKAFVFSCPNVHI